MKNKEKENVRFLYAKNVYNPNIKITDWQLHKEALPTDFNPYCPGNLNYSLSHYKRIGAGKNDEWVTTTKEMLQQIHQKNKRFDQNDEKILINFYTYEDEKKDDYPLRKIYAPDYTTTMQHSYCNHFPSKIEKIDPPKTHWLSYRKFKHQDPRMSNCKFFDEDFVCVSRNMQKYKVEQSYSYDPRTGIYGRN